MDFVRDFGIARLIVTFPSSPTWSTSSFPCSAIDQIRILCWWQDLAISKNVGYTYIDSSRCHCWSTLFWLLMVNLLSFATGPHQRRHCHDSFLPRCKCNKFIAIDLDNSRMKGDLVMMSMKRLMLSIEQTQFCEP